MCDMYGNYEKNVKSYYFQADRAKTQQNWIAKR